MSDVDLSDYEAQLAINGLEILPMDGMPTPHYYADERVLIRVTVENSGPNASEPGHVWFQVDHESPQEVDLPAVYPNASATAEWPTRDPLTHGSHVIRALLSPDAPAGDPGKNMHFEIHVETREPEKQAEDYGWLKELAKTNADLWMTDTFVKSLKTGLEKFQQEAKASLSDVKEVKTDADPAPLFLEMMKALAEVLIPEEGELAKIGKKLNHALTISVPLVTELEKDMHAEAGKKPMFKVAEAKKRLEDGVDNLVTKTQSIYIAAWDRVKSQLEEKVTTAIAELDEVPNMRHHDTDQYWELLRLHLGIPSSADIDLTPVYEEFHRLHMHVLRELNGPEAVEPTL